MPKDINTALLLVNAIDELLGFLKDAVVEKDGASCRGFNRPNYKQFLQLDRTVACYAAEIGISLPALEKLRPSLSLSMSKEVEFIGLSNLPGIGVMPYLCYVQPSGMTKWKGFELVRNTSPIRRIC